jgi:hypothetical protein
MSRRKICIALLAMTWVVASQIDASAAVTKYIDSPRNEFSIAVEAGVHAWAQDTTQHQYVYQVWVKPDGGPRYRVSALSSSASVGNIDLANPSFGDVLVFSSRGGLGQNQSDIKLWDLANHAALVLPAGINSSTADEERPAISGDYLLFTRVQPSGAERLLLYRFSTHSFTSIASATPQAATDFIGTLRGDYVVYDACTSTTCNVFRYRISTTARVEAPNAGHANYWPTVATNGTVYYVQGSFRYCGHHTKLMKWTGAGSATLLTALPEGIEAAAMDTYNDGSSTTLYLSRLVCQGFHYGIYQIPNV